MMKDLLLDIVEVTENSAIESYKWVGLGNKDLADNSAVESMRKSLNMLNISGTVVIGEGERDKAPMLYIGEKLGRGGPEFDIAVDPLEGTTICANGSKGALSVIVIGEKNSLLSAPDIYMNKIAVGGNLPKNIVDIEEDIEKNLENLAKYKNCPLSKIEVVMLNRDRHHNLISRIRNKGSKIKFIEDGDISAIIDISIGKSDIYLGIGGAPEGVIAAAALKSLGGYMQGKLVFNNEDDKNRAKIMGIKDLDKKYEINDLVKSNFIFCATGVTDGCLLKGVKHKNKKIIVNSLLIDNISNSVRNITRKFDN